MANLLKNKKDLDFYIVDFMEYCNIKGLAIKTIKSYESTLMLFKKYLYEEYNIKYLKDIKQKHIQEYVKFTKQRGKYSYVYDDKTIKTNNPQNRKDFEKTVSNITINNYIRNIKVFFNYCYCKDYINVNVASKVKFLKTKRKAKEYIDDKEFKTLIKAIDITKYSEYRDYVIIQLLIDTGMRLGETLAIEIDNIDIENRTILLSADITKGKKDRYVFFSNTMYTILKRWLQYKDRYTNCNLIFCTQRGNKLEVRNFEKNFKVYLKRAGIEKDISPHTLRNNFAKRCLMSGMDIYTLSKILGHSSVTVTEKAYLDLTVTDIRKNYQKFSPLEALKTK